MNCDLTGKKALVTGSSRGIGSAIAKELADCGAEIVLHYAGREDAALNMKELIEKDGGKCSIVHANLCDNTAYDKLISEVGDIDILVLNASVQYKNEWENINQEEFYNQVNCNFLASLALIQGFVPAMRKNKFGRIITIGSVQEAKPHPQMLVYSATKAAQTNMMKSLSLQLAEDNITVNNVAPGVIATDRNAEALADKEYAEIVKNQIPLKFYGEKEDCAPIVRLLCSQEGRYITGQSIYVDGGKSVM
ncbi:MAG: SDR family oxidoreductase [Clostridia bacterium]|nr:SDR family oxidoreductase [Clostridia bacterium]